MENNTGTYRLRHIAVEPPTKLVSLLVSGLTNNVAKPPLGRNQDKMRPNDGTINMVILRSNAIYLLQVKLKAK